MQHHAAHALFPNGTDWQKHPRTVNLFVTSTGTTSISDLTAAVSGRKKGVLCVPVRAWARVWGGGTDGVSAPAGLGILADGDVGVAEPPRGPQPVAGRQQGGV